MFSAKRSSAIAKFMCVGAMLVGPSGVVLAGEERYQVEPGHTYPSLEFNHMGVSIWRGKFTRTRGDITMDRTAHTGSVNIVVDTSSIDFGLQLMDERARTEEYFDTAKWPTMSYTGKLVFSGDAPSAVDGQLTLRGVTHPLHLELPLFNCVQNPFLKRQVCGAEATGVVHWLDYGMKKAEGGADADKVTLHIQVEAVKQE